jgi:AbrB family transcriptional regulator, transcriptional pleiotropic regulator of transition state genes
MKTVGIVRKVDELGRVVIPKELRRVMDIPEGTPLEIFTNENGEVVLRKYEPGCHFCGDLNNLVDYSGVRVCKDCVNYMHDKVHRLIRKSS